MSSTSADFQNLYQALSRSAARSPDALALAFEDRRYLYRDFHLGVSSRFLRSPICRAGSGHRSGAFQH